MGWEVIALGTIELEPNAPIPRVDKFVNKLKADGYVIRAILHDYAFINIEMSGNKGIDYEGVSNLLDEYQNIVLGESVSFGEYSETGDGMYWERKDE